MPKEGVTIAIAPSGVRAPQRAMPAMGGRPANPGEPFGEEAYSWTREHFNQRDVSVDVWTCSRFVLSCCVWRCLAQSALAGGVRTCCMMSVTLGRSTALACCAPRLCDQCRAGR